MIKARAVTLKTGRTIAPFNEPPHAMWVADATIGEALAATYRHHALDVIDFNDSGSDAIKGPAVVLADYAYVSTKLLGDFLKGCRGHAHPMRLALVQSPVSDYMRPVSSVEVRPFADGFAGLRPDGAKGGDASGAATCCFDIYFVPEGAMVSGPNVLAQLRTRAAPLVVRKREIVIPVRLPVLGDGEPRRMQFPISSSIAGHVEHWVHVLWLNQLAFGERWVDYVRAHKVWAAGRALVAFPYRRDDFLASFVQRGRGAYIHPSAHVEASFIGEGARIGARATVRNSFIGKNAEVGDHASVLASTLGDDAYVTPKSFVVWSTAFPGAVLKNLKLQMSLLGRGASVSIWAGLIDAKFQGEIAVLHDGTRRSTERSFLGSCLGHGASMGAKVLLHPGRHVPNNTHIVMRSDELISTVPDDLQPGVPYVRDGGTLVPLADLRSTTAR